MPKLVPQADLEAVLQAVDRFPEGASIEDIGGAIEVRLPRRTLQRRLALLVEQKRLIVEGRARSSRYRLPVITAEAHIVEAGDKLEAYAEVYVPVSPEGEAIKQAVRQPVQKRHPVGYNRAFLDVYRPNDTYYLPLSIRRRLLELGRSPDGVRPAGTYVRRFSVGC